MVAARNYFGACYTAVNIYGASCPANKVQGNWLGLNLAGTAEMGLLRGVSVSGGAGVQTIGGTSAECGNRFVVTKRGALSSQGVFFASAGSDSVVQYSIFGVRGDNGAATGMSDAVLTNNVFRLNFGNNTVANCNIGICGIQGSLYVFANVFRKCVTGVMLDNKCLGVLGEAVPPIAARRGANTFETSNTYSVYNNTPHTIYAENNSWGSIFYDDTNEKIYDIHDNAACGGVDFDPLFGGNHPATSPRVCALAVTSAAMPTAAGAEIVVCTTAPGRVSVNVLNLAGRVVSRAADDLALGAGRNSILWNGRTARGTAAPAGAYLVQVTIRGEDGSVVSRVCPLDRR